MKRYCDYCKKSIVVKNYASFGAHKSNCLLNPKLKEKHLKIAKSLTLPRKKYYFKCKRCQKPYSLILLKSKFMQSEYRKHCSTKCAHFRIVTNETKNKISLKLRGNNPKFVKIICKKCGKENNVLYKRRYKQFCNRSCASSYINSHKIVTQKTRIKMSKIVKNAYKNGRLFYGGKTKWFSVKTSNGMIKVCGKYEVRTCKILDYLKLNKKIKDWEYTPDRIRYIGLDKKYHWYLIDFKIYKSKKKFYYIETKSQPLSKKDKIKLLTVKKLGYEIISWLKKDLEHYENLMSSKC